MAQKKPVKKTTKADLQFEFDSDEATGSGSKTNTSVSESESFNEVLVEEIIFPGKIMNDDYLLLIKIGYGNNAGVWMVYQISTKTYVAMKIQDYECYDDGRREIKIIKKINQLSVDTKTFCIKMLDFFTYEESADMKFVCSVYNLYAGSLGLLIKSGKYKYGLPIQVVKLITKQMLSGIAFLHTKAEVIHTDIKPENILFEGIPHSHVKVTEIFDRSMFPTKYAHLKTKYESNQDKFIEKRDKLAVDSVSELQYIEEPFENHINSDSSDESDGSDIEGEDDFNSDDAGSDGDEEADDSDTTYDSSDDEEAVNTRKQSVPDKPSFMRYRERKDLEPFYNFVVVRNNKSTTTDPADVIDDSYVNKCKVVLTDFGNSYFYKKRTGNEIQDRIYRCPEVILDFKYNYASDMWAVGCVVFELLTGYPLFMPNSEPLNKDLNHLFLMEKILGPMPIAMRKKSRDPSFYLIKNVTFISRTLNLLLKLP